MSHNATSVYDESASVPRLTRNQSDTPSDKEVGVDSPSSSSTLPTGGQLSYFQQLRISIREPAAEFLGTMVLCLIGTASNCQVVLSSKTSVSATPAGDWTSLSLGWAAGIALGVWVSAGISGGHINPAVTLAMAVFRRFPWRKVPIYFLAQLLGGIVGAAFTYANYHTAISLFEGGSSVRTVPGTASLFGTFPSEYLSAGGCWFEEFLGAALLIMVIFAVTDKRNAPPPPGLVPLVLFMSLLAISAAIGMQTGFAINPARDLGPRILTAMVGYGVEVFNFRSQYWLWCPVIAPFCGGLAGAFVYDVLISSGPDSFVDRLFTKSGVPVAANSV